MIIRSLLAGLIFLTAGCFSLFRRVEGPRNRKPNVILISVDSLRADHVGAYGYSRATTPNIDMLAKESFVYTNYFSTSFITPISEASVHTGLYPMRNGMISFGNDVAESTPLLAEIFKKNGYSTLAVGNSPEFNMFAPRRSFSRGFDVFINQRTRDKGPISFQKIRTQLAEQKEGNFIWVHLAHAHAPFVKVRGADFVDPGYAGPFVNYSFWGNAHYYYDHKIYKRTELNQIQYYGTGLQSNKTVDTLEVNFGSKNEISIGPLDIAHIVNAYDEGVWAADREVGRILSLLKEAGVYENSVIILQSEHGEDLDDHKIIAHYDIHDTTTHVPLVFKPLGKTESNGHLKTSSGMVSGIDILPSLLRYLGMSPIPQTDGRDSIFTDFQNLENNHEIFITRTPLWETVLEVRNSPFFDQIHKENQFGIYADFAVRNRRWKVIHRRSRLLLFQFSVWKFITKMDIDVPIFELFDTESDPAEQKNLSVWNDETLALKERLLNWEQKQFEQTPVGRTIYGPQEYR